MVEPRTEPVSAADPTTRDDMQTSVVGIKKMNVTADAATEWNVVLAAAMLAMLPPGGGGGAHAALVRERPGGDGKVMLRRHGPRGW
jgi:hypothetical protein